ncbi:cbb3-type cytochrome c oxidase subunit 3 [Undibacterium seohonense]|jgi:cytochrome c oxidase cbb3-type subunit 4|uniref:Cbb3-type cytochrome c oxidase subunit 3 n=1 Tax=Undibacterium seohonense TaxID=1344950 RepID=A0ABR6X8U2_9BURK|nr:cbb3-type cytochrome c oxidase subunit 3 [Undibacterium seohonense]MBC3808739.1 cbb3-type cytochrome c oxidase subunit 3 [Undibacterium seohonense]
MSFTILSSVMTVISMIAFIGILYWAFSSKNKARFEKQAQLPQDEENGKEPWQTL